MSEDVAVLDPTLTREQLAAKRGWQTLVHGHGVRRRRRPPPHERRRGGRHVTTHPGTIVWCDYCHTYRAGTDPPDLGQ